MLWRISQRTFNGGQLDRRLMGRTDLVKYFQGASMLQNFIVMRQGCIARRPGTRVIHAIDYSEFANATNFRLIPFAFSRDCGYVIVLFAADNVVATCLICDSSGAMITRLAVPYEGATIREIEYCQSGDTLFLAHRDYPFAHIIHKDINGAPNFSYSAVEFSTLDHIAIPNTPTINKITKNGFTGTGPSVKVEYCATAVKDSVESRQSATVSQSYYSPWTDGATITLSIKPSALADVDSYYVYKRRNGRNWGFIGKVDNGPSEFYDAPVKSFTTAPNSQTCGTANDAVVKFASNELQDLSWPIFHTAKIDNCSTSDANYGRVISDGQCTLAWNEPKSIASLHLGLGFAMRWAIYNGKYLGQYIPCKIKKIVATFHLDDGTEKSVTNIVPSSVWDDTIKVEGTSVSTVNNSLKNSSPDVWLDFDLYTPGQLEIIKKVNSVDIKAYTDDDLTVLASGSLVVPETPGSDYATIEGDPLVVRRIYITTLTVNTRDAIQFVDDYIDPDQSVTPPKYEPFFNEAGKYPGCVTLYQQRLVLASTHDQPFTVWMSCIGDIYNFNVHDSMREDDAIEITLPALKYPDINHMAVNRDLILFCDNGEWIISPIVGNALSYATASTKVESQIGGSRLHQPIVVGNDILFVNSTDETVVATKYDFTSDGYGTQDLSVLSHDIFRDNPITSLTYQKDPDSIIVATLADGSFATLTYMKEHEVVAWSVHRLPDGVNALAVTTDGSMTNGVTNTFLLDDSGRLLRFTPVPEIADDPRQLASLDFLSEVDVDTIVPAGKIAVSPAGQVLLPGQTAPANSIVGTAFESTLVTVRPEPSPQETVQFEVKNPTRINIRLHKASSFAVGQFGMPRNADKAIVVDSLSHGDGKWTVSGLDASANITGGNGCDGRIILSCKSPWPLTVLALFATYQVEKMDQNLE